MSRPPEHPRPDASRGCGAPLPVASDWFAWRRLEHSVVMLDEPHLHPLLRANIFLVEGRERDLLVDTGNGLGDLATTLATIRADPHKPLVAVATHAHPDHAGGLHQFGERFAHPLEVDALARPWVERPLLGASYPQELHAAMRADGAPLADVLLTAAPGPGFEPAAFAQVACAPTRLVEHGDIVDLGDRRLTVLHLAGHSPGSVGLWEEDTGTLFAGDVVYDEGPLLDDLPGSDPGDYARSVHRLRALPVTVVHAGHDVSFSRARLHEVIDEYLASGGRA